MPTYPPNRAGVRGCSLASDYSSRGTTALYYIPGGQMHRAEWLAQTISALGLETHRCDGDNEDDEDDDVDAVALNREQLRSSTFILNTSAIPYI